MQNAFTIVELLVVVSIIAVLSVIGLVVYSGITDRALATRYLTDYHEMKNAWDQYVRLNDIYWPNQDDFIMGDMLGDGEDASTLCGSWSVNPPMSYTPIYTSTPPYMNNIAKDPVTGREYRYDNDFSDYEATHIAKSGVNIRSYFCSSRERNRMVNIVKILDEMQDKGDGANFGRIRWQEQGGLIYDLILNLSNYYKIQ